MKKSLCIAILAVLTNLSTAQSIENERLIQNVQAHLYWSAQPIPHTVAGQVAKEIYSFKGAVYQNTAPTLPQYQTRFPVPATGHNGRVTVELTREVYEPIQIAHNADVSMLDNALKINTFYTIERKQSFANVQFIPIRRKGGGFEKLVSFEVKITVTPMNSPLEWRGRNYTYHSALKTGEIYKIAIKETGIYKLDYNFLKNDLKISNLDNINPKTIQLYGNGGGMVIEKNAIARPDDLTENNIEIVGGDDGKFDPIDYILFYAIGVDKVVLGTDNWFHKPKHLYDDKCYYFLKVNAAANGLRVTPQNSVPNPAFTTTTFNAVARYEDDKYNLLYENKYRWSQGSGKGWYGDYFGETTREKTFSDKFSFPNVVTNEPANVRVRFAGSGQTSDVAVTVAGQTFQQTVPTTNPTSVESIFAQVIDFQKNINLVNENPEVKINYLPVSGTEGWLDFIEINARRQLQMVGSQMGFRDLKTKQHAISAFQISNMDANVTVWDVTNPLLPLKQEGILNGSNFTFGANTNNLLREYIGFKKTEIVLKPEAIGKVSNQNLHAIDNIDMLIVYHKDFENATQLLAQHRKTFSALNVATAEVSQIYNEFSSGMQDPGAIRDFAKMLYDRNLRFKYMLLMGDGSFDAQGRTAEEKARKTNFIPAYETDESFDPIEAFPSDDFYALLDSTEGEDLAGNLDIAVGRIPCKDAIEAESVVRKIIKYESNPESFGDWRNRAVFAADDEDSNYHLMDADEVADRVYNETPNFNLDKLYIDAYRQEISAGGTRVPGLNDAIAENEFRGMLAFTYLGHGGPKGLAQERILMREDLESWQNINKLPLIITATCSFAGYDTPKEVTAGEVAILNPSGGAIGLFATVRAVYASTNATLVNAVYDTIFKKRSPVFAGEVLRIAKNHAGTGSNGQKFTLLGDPAMRLSLPKYEITTSKINHRAVDATLRDTFKALQKVTIEGFVRGDNGQVLTNFNGKIYPTVFDKALIAKTLGQDAGSYVRDFRVQRNIIFKGVATVKNGAWSFSFVVPRDINYDFGKGKISYYAYDGGLNDATGSFSKFIVGGTDLTVAADNQPPVVQVFMNDENFVSGGNTNVSPTLFAKLSDDTGINVTGISIGHDLTSILDGGQTRVLNSFYQAAQDDHKRGTLSYPLSNLAVGKHTIRVKAWDVSNNSGEAMTDFIVTKDAKTGLSYVLNYPNPFTTHTEFRFEHGLTGQGLRVQINILTIGGKLVKTIDQTVFSNGNLVSGIAWDGKDEYGEALARGVYIYQVKLFGQNNEKIQSNFEKLVLLK
jgi:Peptidase family C25/FlgD Ig-like domain